MIGEILSTGDEIRTGALVDSNSAFIAQALEDAGVEVVRLNGVGDDLARLVAVLKEIGARSDVAVVTGGLGPTIDDLSAEAASRAVDAGLRLEPAALAAVEAFYRKRRRPMNPSVRKQALLPEGSAMIPNPVGTAPGFSLRIGGCRFYFLPGVPREMKRMLAEHVLPDIGRLMGPARPHRLVRTLSCFGLTESLTGERIAGLEGRFPGIKPGLRAAFPVIQVKLYTSGTDADAAAARIEQAAAWAREKLLDVLFTEAGEPMESVVGRLLKAQGASLAVAESCTGGLISHLLTEVPGSSNYFLLAVVAYANDAKTRLLGVDPGTIETVGAVHEDTAVQMADGARRLAGATYGIATSGIAGPSGGTDDKPVGTVCIGLAGPGAARGYRFHYNYGRRALNKQMFALKALDLLRRQLLGLPHTVEAA